jgi:hypothetical protein
MIGVDVRLGETKKIHPSPHRLMHFDDVALRVMEEHLMPFFGKGSSIV